VTVKGSRADILSLKMASLQEYGGPMLLESDPVPTKQDPKNKDVDQSITQTRFTVSPEKVATRQIRPPSTQKVFGSVSFKSAGASQMSFLEALHTHLQGERGSTSQMDDGTSMSRLSLEPLPLTKEHTRSEVEMDELDAEKWGKMETEAQVAPHGISSQRMIDNSSLPIEHSFHPFRHESLECNAQADVAAQSITLTSSFGHPSPNRHGFTSGSPGQRLVNPAIFGSNNVTRLCQGCPDEYLGPCRPHCKSCDGYHHFIEPCKKKTSAIALLQSAGISGDRLAMIQRDDPNEDEDTMTESAGEMFTPFGNGVNFLPCGSRKRNRPSDVSPTPNCGSSVRTIPFTSVDDSIHPMLTSLMPPTRAIKIPSGPRNSIYSRRGDVDSLGHIRPGPKPIRSVDVIPKLEGLVNVKEEDTAMSNSEGPFATMRPKRVTSSAELLNYECTRRGFSPRYDYTLDRANPMGTAVDVHLLGLVVRGKGYYYDKRAARDAVCIEALEAVRQMPTMRMNKVKMTGPPVFKAESSPAESLTQTPDVLAQPAPRFNPSHHTLPSNIKKESVPGLVQKAVAGGSFIFNLPANVTPEIAKAYGEAFAKVGGTETSYPRKRARR
jgi:hypothetical protein